MHSPDHSSQLLRMHATELLKYADSPAAAALLLLLLLPNGGGRDCLRS